MVQNNLQDFLSEHRISQSTWNAAAIDWAQLVAIAEDHDQHRARLNQTGSFLGAVIQQFDAVHSVRWRVKDTSHLIEKIIRKRAEKVAKYERIDVSNYFEVVTDLVGIRALHLFKEDCFSIDQALRKEWNPVEPPVAYVRSGDQGQVSQQLRDQNFQIAEHPAGYRSIHYIIASQPLQRRVLVEVQVRTIFEEGWSEIDHKVRYPNFSSHELVGYFLAIFNRLAGSADEMGSFVKGLTTTLEAAATEIRAARDERDKSIADMQAALEQLEAQKDKDAASQRSIATLKAELDKLRRQAENGEKHWYSAVDRLSAVGNIPLSLSDAATRVSIANTTSEATKALRELSLIDSVALKDVMNSLDAVRIVGKKKE